uniref:Uncharacterized protein n=1 Tax=Picea sitchensis TaxID=3332 RepID=D5AD22_PICSI|nr:unknown [Picea sitchensis]
MGWESSALNNGKRVREPEDAVYLDNYHSQKRYLSEVMASSLNGLTVGDSLSESPRMLSPSRFDPMESPARTETVSFSREELAAQYSPMSEDSDDCVGYRMIRCNDSPQHISMTQSDQVISSPTSPVSPQRNQRTINGAGSQFGCSSFTSSTGAGSSSLGYMTSFPLPCTQPRQRSSDSESRFPPSPSDPCQSADLRRAALLRSLQMRAQPPIMPSFEMSVDNISEQGMHHIEESEDQSSPFVKSLTEHDEYSFGSPANEIFSAQPIRSSGRVRSLLLDECTLSTSVSIAELSTSSEQEDEITGISCTNEDNCYTNMNSKNKTGDLASNAKD